MKECQARVVWRQRERGQRVWDLLFKNRWLCKWEEETLNNWEKSRWTDKKVGRERHKYLRLWGDGSPVTQQSLFRPQPTASSCRVALRRMTEISHFSLNVCNILTDFMVILSYPCASRRPVLMPSPEQNSWYIKQSLLNLRSRLFDYLHVTFAFIKYVTHNLPISNFMQFRNAPRRVIQNRAIFLNSS